MSGNLSYNSVKEWYRYIVNCRDKCYYEEDGPGGKKRTSTFQDKGEASGNFLSDSNSLCHLKCLSPDNNSLGFNLLYTLLPSNLRVNHLNPNSSTLCCCYDGVQET